jgi:HNH endonuclease
VANDVTDELRAAVAQRASGRCEYCLIDERDTGFPHQVDHIVSRKHGGLSTLENLALACVICNRYKGSDLASLDSQTGELSRLFNPRQNRWEDHFRLRDAIIEPVSTIGRVTVRLLRLNATERTAERQLLQELGRYPEHR